MKMLVTYRLLVSFIVLMTLSQAGMSQFYNGLHMRFGKNRIQYQQADVLESDFFFSFYRFNRYDVYFNPNGQELAEYVGEKVYSELNQLENFFEHGLSKRMIFIVFNRLTDYRQSNIGLISGQDETNIGGVTRILDNKVFLYFDGDHKNLDKQIRGAITEVILNEMLYGGSVRERVTSSTLINLPEWFYKGLISYMSEKWSVEIEDRVKDGILSGRFEKFNKLTGDDAIFAGHSIWYFISEYFGESLIPNIVYFTKINRSGSAGFLNVLGISLNGLSYEWLHYFKTRYANEQPSGTQSSVDQLSLKNRKELKYLRVRSSPDGRYLAYTNQQQGKLKIYLYDTETGKHQKIYKSGAKLNQLQDLTLPAIAWHPSGQLLAMATEYKGKVRLSIYPIETHKWEHQILELYEKVLDFDYSDDGLSLVISGVIKGQSDIFIHNLVAHTNERISNDLADDFNPRFIENSSKIIFSSNRVNDSLNPEVPDRELAHTHDLFVYDYQNQTEILTRIAGEKYIDRLKPIGAGTDSFVFLGDDSGIRSRFLAKYDSTIAFVDTTTHYRYFTEVEALEISPQNILDHSYSESGQLFSDLKRSNNKYFLERLPLKQEAQKLDFKTEFRRRQTAELKRDDSIALVREATRNILAPITKRISETGIDSAPVVNRGIDINNYVFDRELEEQNIRKRFKLPPTTGIADPVSGRAFKLPNLRIYQPAFYINYLASQVDFSFLNAAYQPFTGGSVYYNPGVNMLMKIGTQDLFEDYKLTGGVRFGGDFDSNEFLLSFESLKHRVDHEWVFHQQAYTNTTTDYMSLVKTSSQNLYYVAKYPFSQVSSVRGTASLRSDRSVYLSTDQFNLMQSNIQKFWSGLKLEYVYDNSYQHGINLYEGFRAKVFGEYYKQINGNWSDVFILGGDIRHYQPLHRTLIWANRLAASTSFGNSRLIYYMGGVDNWTNLSKKIPTFDSSVPIDTTQFFVFQTLATNMRGFSQNIRNGNSFAVFNSEIRWPIIRYFANKPINSDFLNNLQLIGFADVGTAWSGPTPWNERNHLNREVIENGPITVIIDKGNEPLVAGFGFGVRSRLLGYFVRLDWAWGIENDVLLPRVFYLSLSLDF